MIQLSPQSRIFVALEPADFRRGIDGLAALCRQRLAQDPFSGAIFVFRNRRKSALKLLCYDGLVGAAPALRARRQRLPPVAGFMP